MANEIMIKIKVENDSAEGYEKARTEAREFVAKLKEEFDKVDPINVKLDDEEAKLKIKEIEEELAKLNGDDATIHVKIKEEDVKKAGSQIKDDLEKPIEEAGSSGGTGWANSFTSSLKNFDFKPGLMPVGIAIGAAFAPLIGASIAGVIVGGLGLGGIVGGVVLAARDARVQSAFSALRKNLGDSLKVDAAPFVPVVIDGIGAIKTAMMGIDFKGIFKDLAPQVQPVLNGVLSLVSSLGEALKNVAANSGPVLKELGTDFRNMGNALEAGINSLTDNGQQEAQALHDLFGVVDGGITIVFGLVDALTEVYGAFHRIIDLSPVGFYELMQDHSQKLGGAVRDQVSAVVAAVDANNALAGSSKGAAAAAAAQTKAINTVSDALKAATDPAFALIDAQKQVNDAQGAYNKAVKTGGTNSKAAKNAQVDLDKAYVNLVGSLAKAGGGTGHLTDQQKALLKSAGASAGTIKSLDTQLQNAYKSAHRLDGYNVDITVTEHFKQTGKYISPSQFANPTQLYSGLASGGIKGAANGATSSGLTWVGETGPELMNLPPGTSVRSAGDSKRTAGQMDGAGGPLIVQLHVDGQIIARAMVDPQRKFVQQNFGGNVQAAYGIGA